MGQLNRDSPLPPGPSQRYHDLPACEVYSRANERTRTSTGKASISVRKSTDGPSPLRRMATTPVPPTPVVTHNLALACDPRATTIRKSISTSASPAKAGKRPANRLKSAACTTTSSADSSTSAPPFSPAAPAAPVSATSAIGLKRMCRHNESAFLAHRCTVPVPLRNSCGEAGRVRAAAMSRAENAAAGVFRPTCPLSAGNIHLGPHPGGGAAP